jgi:RND family efflux transporter MFP subunit
VAIDRLFLSLLMATVLVVAPLAARAESGASSTAEVVAEPPAVSSPPPPLEAARGTVRPSKQVTLLARLDGVVKSVAVEEGATVTEGELLVQLDDAVQTARVAAAKAAADSSADVKSGTLDVQEKGAVLARTESAAKDAAATDWELRVARHGMAQARAKLQAAEERHALDVERLHQEEALADQYRLLAPFAGRVTRVEVKPGATVTKDTKLVTVVALEELEAVLFLPVAWFGALEVGKTYSLSADEPVNGALDAVLDAVEPIIDPGSHTVRCVFTIQNPQSKLPAGFAVSLAPLR